VQIVTYVAHRRSITGAGIIDGRNYSHAKGAFMVIAILSIRRKPMTIQTANQSDLAALAALNEEYIRAVQRSDVRRFDELLAADFRCSNPDSTFLDRAGFLAQTARPVAIANLAAHDVEIRLFGDTAIIHARTSYTLPNGRAGAGRYTDVWVRENGQWRAVSAHVTRG
jgi:ketosteroid isomerase-like protein